MRIDLHTHSDRSDGTDSPASLVRRAHKAHVDVLGLTDHDTTEGWKAAADVAARTAITLVRGIEVSCRFHGDGVHLLAYLPDPAYPPLTDELARILDGRNSRLPAILHRLSDLGIDVDVTDVRAVSQDTAAMGRPHVADALVAKRVVASREEAFDRFLGPQAPAYVDRYAADLVTMIGTVREAGGVSVIAHPWAKRHRHRGLDAEGFAALRDAGLAGLEVDHLDHDQAARDGLRRIAADLDLVVTGSSDYHGAGKAGHPLACDTTAAEEYERLLDRADQAARAAGRSTPGIVVGR
ncbi:MAG TPA: PHP domain-containing protein [Nocardioidaceae bacterium]|nr:PHP domain-containing protein [Nocardioidaceae bacterium]